VARRRGHAARAQQAAIPVISFLSPSLPEALVDRLRAFHQGLKEAGYAEGLNVAIEYRWAHEQFNRLPELAADLVHRKVAVIVASINPSAALVKRRAKPNQLSNAVRNSLSH